MAGLVLATLHRIPRTGEEFQIPGYTITVLEADARRVAAVKIAPLTAAGARPPAPPSLNPSEGGHRRCPARWWTFPSNGSTTHGYLATPASGKGPGVLVIQEWWGLVGHIKSVCDRFAAEGFAALAPDMYHGQTASEPDGAGKLFMALNIAPGREGPARRRHVSWPSTRRRAKLGAVGFCMGGQLALFAATAQSQRRGRA